MFLAGGGKHRARGRVARPYAARSPLPSTPMSNHTRAITRLFETISLGAPENAVGFVLWRVVHRYQREADRALAVLDLTNLQFMSLALAAWLGRSGEVVTQSDIARAGDIQPMQVSHMLKTLEDKGLIARVRNSSDMRAKQIEITANGLTALRRALPVMIEVQQRLFGADGAVGGSLLTRLLRLDAEQIDETNPTF